LLVPVSKASTVQHQSESKKEWGADLSSEIPSHNKQRAQKDGYRRDLLHLDHFNQLKVVQADHGHDRCLSGHRHDLVQELHFIFVGPHENKDEPTNRQVDDCS
jgi:hypothetical protein